MMEVLRDIGAMQARAEELRLSRKRIGVVPTMGALHEGHLTLIKAAREHADVVVTTVFVNPAQFGPHEDFLKYPRDPDRDISLASASGSTLLFMPGAKEMYPDGFLTNVQTDRVAMILEGAFRPGHFRGVTTVVAKLFHVVKPHVAVFGQKDIQQAFVIRRMIRDLNFDIDMIVVPIVREENGLAKSSRNVYLSPAERERASSIVRALRAAEGSVQRGERNIGTLREEMIRVLRSGEPTAIDYVAFLDPETFDEVTTMPLPTLLIAVAVRFGPTRLLDNIMIPVSQ